MNKTDVKNGSKEYYFVSFVGFQILRFGKKAINITQNMTSRSILRNFYLYSMKKNNKCPIMQIYSVILKIHLYFLKFKGNDLLDKIEYKFPVEIV